jgi:kynurenine formamidase
MRGTSGWPPEDPLLAAVRQGVRLIDLGHYFVAGMPTAPVHTGFQMGLTRRHGDRPRPDGGSGASEVIITGGHVGTHVDALAHTSQDGLLHGGVNASEAERGGSFREYGAEKIPPLLTRGVLLDVAKLLGCDHLAPGYGITAADLEAAAQQSEVVVGVGDVVLIRTGWARLWGNPAAYLGGSDGVPGATVPAAEWLAERGIVATGSDTGTYEQRPRSSTAGNLPVHRTLLVDGGIHIIEHMDLELVAREGRGSFTFIMAPLPIVGGTASPVRPLAAITESPLHRWLLADAEAKDGDGSRSRAVERFQVYPRETRGEEPGAVTEQHRDDVHQDLVD